MFNPFSHLPSWQQIEKAMGEARLDAAETLLAEHLQLYSQDSEAWILQGYFDCRANRLAQALESYQQALLIQPQHAEAWFNRALIQLLLEQHHAAIESLRSVLQLAPEHPLADYHLALAYTRLGWYLHASSHLEKALQRQPEHANSWLDIGFALHMAGQTLRQQFYLQEMLAKLLPRRENYPTWLADLLPQIPLFQAQYLLACYADFEQPDPLLLAKMHQAVALGAFEPVEPMAPSAPLASLSPSNSPGPGQRLRVGYLSREMGIFSSSTTLLPLLENHDRSQFELFAYSDLKGDDEWVGRFRACFEHWCASAELSETELEQRIRADGIQILIDLSGLIHSVRLCLFARRPAPIQLTGLGFGWPTALPQMDGFFTDQRLWPPETAPACPEPLLYLSTAIHWLPPPDKALAPVPSCLGQPLSLGCANNLAKLNLRVLETWAEILNALPEARLCLKTAALNDPLSQEWLYLSFEHLGIARERILLWGVMSEHEHISWFYAQVDLALDPFPYCGGVTTLEALWMGVPVISLKSKAHAHRAVGASILSVLDLPELIADSREDYLAKTVALARNPERLQAYRLLLRPRLAASPICDGPLFAREVEAHLHRLWQDRVVSFSS